MGWATFLTTLVFFSRSFKKQAACIFIVFFLLGNYLGPYLEPPADPLDHLKRTHSYFEKNGKTISKQNRGFWHYSMSSSVLYFPDLPVTPEKMLARIDLLHGLYLAMAMVTLFILAKSISLPDRWAFFSIVMALFFLGTNRFSYFSYYSLSPSFSSIIIYWLWTAAFFFKKDLKSILAGLIMAAMILPILMVNHLQEIFFVILVVSLWVILNIHIRIWPKLGAPGSKIGYILIYLFLFFIMPQSDFFLKLITPLKGLDFWARNQSAIVHFDGLYLIGKMWSLRVNETLGIIGLIPVFLLGLNFIPGLLDNDSGNKSRIFILGILPFIGYGVPFYLGLWVSNCKLAIYYRLCYSSMFWLTITYVLSDMEKFLVRIKPQKIQVTRS